MLDILIYVFENHLRSHQGIKIKPDQLQGELADAGFDQENIDEALAWLDELKGRQSVLKSPEQASRVLPRVFQEEEITKLGASNIRLLVELSLFGVLKSELMELVIDRLMALPGQALPQHEVKCIILMILFSSPGSEHPFAMMEYFLMKDELSIH